MHLTRFLRYKLVSKGVQQNFQAFFEKIQKWVPGPFFIADHFHLEYTAINRAIF